MRKDEPIIVKLKLLASAANTTITHCGNGHYQVKGKLLVNYYPFAKRMTAYIDATVGGEHFVTPERVIQMANRPPKIVKHSQRDKRKHSYRAIRKRLIRRHGAFCHWCKAVLTLDTSTIDHEIPLARGGLDNENNMVLACEKCNHDRGHNMPELKVKKP